MLDVGDRASLDFNLQLARAEEQVTVTADHAVVNPLDPAVSTVVDQEVVQNMPLNCRSFQSLIALSPGVVFTAPDLEQTLAGGDPSIDHRWRHQRFGIGRCHGGVPYPDIDVCARIRTHTGVSISILDRSRDINQFHVNSSETAQKLALVTYGLRGDGMLSERLLMATAR